MLDRRSGAIARKKDCDIYPPELAAGQSVIDPAPMRLRDDLEHFGATRLSLRFFDLRDRNSESELSSIIGPVGMTASSIWLNGERVPTTILRDIN